jgi:hypothetical protein
MERRARNQVRGVPPTAKVKPTSIRLRPYEVAAYNQMHGRSDDVPTQRVTLELLNPKDIEVVIE